MNLNLNLDLAQLGAAAEIAALRNAAARRLHQQHGPGPWAGNCTERGVLFDLRQSRVFVARRGAVLIASFRLVTKKPWAIDTKYFTAVKRPLYLLSMAVAPEQQREGIGRWCLEEARRVAREWPADALRLDAFDAAAGAGEFYRKCGFRETGRVTYRGCPLIYFEMMV